MFYIFGSIYLVLENINMNFEEHSFQYEKIEKYSNLEKLNQVRNTSGSLIGHFRSKAESFIFVT